MSLLILGGEGVMISGLPVVRPVVRPLVRCQSFKQLVRLQR